MLQGNILTFGILGISSVEKEFAHQWNKLDDVAKAYDYIITNQKFITDMIHQNPCNLQCEKDIQKNSNQDPGSTYS